MFGLEKLFKPEVRKRQRAIMGDEKADIAEEVTVQKELSRQKENLEPEEIDGRLDQIGEMLKKMQALAKEEVLNEEAVQEILDTSKKMLADLSRQNALKEDNERNARYVVYQRHVDKMEKYLADRQAE